MRLLIRSASIGYMMRDDHAKIIETKGKRIRDCAFLVAECIVVRETITRFRRTSKDNH